MSMNNENVLNPDDGQPTPYYQSPEHTAPKVAPFTPDKKDAAFALITFVLGYFFCRWVLTSLSGWGITVFTGAFISAVLTYFHVKSVKPRGEAWFWLGITALVGLSFAIWDAPGLSGVRTLFLACAAVYAVLSASGLQLLGKSSNFLLLDGLNATIIIPFRNFANQYRALGTLKSAEEKRGKAISIVVGIMLAIVALLIVLPTLMRADGGGFSQFVGRVLDWFRIDWAQIGEFLLYCLLAIPTAAYLFGLVSGAAVRRGTDTFTADKAGETVSSMRVSPPVTLLIVLATVSVLYTLFIGFQVPYFFSAFSGVRPEGWLSYSAYARQGFFELCGLSALNLGILAAANVFGKKPRENSPVLKIFNVVLALITLLLIATAFSKMALYIDQFGLTILRILPCVFMILLAVICIAVIVLQKLKFSIVRGALITGAVLFTALCLSNADGIVARYNADRFLAGTLETYDTAPLYEAGAAGVASAIRVYEAASEDAPRIDIANYLASQEQYANDAQWTYKDTFQKRQARILIQQWTDEYGTAY